MNKNIIWIIGIIVAVALFTGAYFLYGALSESYAPDNLETAKQTEDATTDVTDEEDENKAPDFTVYTSDGKAVKLSDYFGRPIVMNFWASWCSPCKAEMPHFEEAYKEHGDVTFLMVNMTSGDSRADAEALIEDEGYTFPVLFDTDGDAAMTYGASSLPMTLFIDEDGRFVTYAVGMLDKATLEKGIGMIK
jgi:thiol-disulfide isomerase/thioredoxin